MDFELKYSPEQEAFRKEVRAFLEANIPPDLEEPVDPADLSYEQYLMRRELGRKLGERGWLFPTFPKEYGGGGLPMELAVIIEEELDRYGLSLPPFYNTGGTLGAPCILVWGTEEQKRHFLPPILKGEVRVWQLLTEPGAGSDLASVKTLAVRDGDHYVINGQKTFVGSLHGADWLWTIVCTDPNGRRHENLSWFMIPADLPGISMTPLDLLMAGGEGGASPGAKYTVYFDNVRVPAFNLIGGENNGWKVATTHLELEHGGAGSIRRNRIVDRLIEYCKTTYRNGRPLSQDPDVQDLLVECYIDAEIGRLFNLRNYWLRHTRRPRTYEGPQASLHRKVSGLRIAEAILKALGPYALTNDPAWDPSGGHLEVFHRASIVATHPGGTIEIQKVIMARRIGIGRAVREEAGTVV
ncbi:MAG: hypothetical protein C4315_01250 [Chloroflexota bacterium]